MNDVFIEKGAGGLGRREANTDNIRGLVMNAGANAPAGIALNTPLLCLQLKDAEDAGIDATYDTTESVLCHYHIKEFFLKNPNGKLWVFLTTQATTLEDMVDPTASSPCAVKQLALATNGEVKRFGVGRNPASSYTPTITNGLDGDVLTAIPKAEALNVELFNNHIPEAIILEGRSFTGSPTAASDLRTLQSPSVSVVIGQDLDAIPTGANAVLKAHAAIGACLGTSSASKVHENIGWVQKFNLADVANSSFLNIGLSSNQALSSYTQTDLDTLNTKGYIFARKFVGNTGAYWNDSHTCTDISSDYAYMENVDTIHKAVRGVYKSLLPKVNSPVKVNADGQLSPEVITSFESIAGRPLNDMEISEEVSAWDVYIDPNQNIVSQSKLNVKIAIVPIGTARRIEVTIGYAVSIQ